MGPRYQDAGQMARWVTILLPLYLLATLGNIVFSWLQFQRNGGMSSSQLAADGFMAMGVGIAISLVGTGIYIALIILFCLWYSRAHQNAAALSGAPLRASAGWAVGSWFIPLAGGFLAMGPLGEVWDRAPGGLRTKPSAWAALFSLSQVVSFIGAIVIGVMAFGEVASAGTGTSRFDPSAFFGGFSSRFILLSLAQYAVLAAAGVFMWICVNAIQAAQAHLASGGAARAQNPQGLAWK